MHLTPALMTAMRIGESEDEKSIRISISASFMLTMSMKMIRTKDPFPIPHTNRMTVEERLFPNWY